MTTNPCISVKYSHFNSIEWDDEISHMKKITKCKILLIQLNSPIPYLDMFSDT